MSSRVSQNVVVVGGKLAGLLSALRIKQKYPDRAVAVVEREPFLTDHYRIVDRSATLSGTKTLHSGAYYAHRGHSRGRNPAEQRILANLLSDTKSDYGAMLRLLNHYDLAPSQRDSRTLYLMFQGSFVEPGHFARSTRRHGVFARPVRSTEFDRLRRILRDYRGPSGQAMELAAAFECRDALVDLVQLLNRLERDLMSLGVIMLGRHEITGTAEGSVLARSGGRTIAVPADCIVNATGAFTAQTAKALLARPPSGGYDAQYRHLAMVDRRAAPIFDRISAGRYTFFRLFQNDFKVTLSEVIGDRSKVCFYAPELVPVPVERVDLAFRHRDLDPGLARAARCYGVDAADPTFRSYVGLAPYTRDGRTLLHETATDTGVPVLNVVIEKMSGASTGAPDVADWVGLAGLEDG
ncbi:MAG TPA: FAD-dependent oxidoreductase [Mycobacteriales bacterium]|nr:FAD-dependent oxidoreductase [Mycobacteriales bacterium]